MDCLKKLRVERGLLQKDVAEALRIDRTTYVKYENGKSHPDYDMLKRIASYYGVSTDFLLNYELRMEAINQLKDQLETEQAVELFSDLSPEEIQRVRDFVAGLKASRKA